MAVETKVTAATVASMVTGLVVTWLGTGVFHGTVPDAVVGIVGAAITGVVTFAAGWLAKHTPRPANLPGPVVPPTNSAAPPPGTLGS